MVDDFARFDEQDDIIQSMRLLVDELRRLDKRPGAWRWVVTSLHSAMQGLMVFHLSFGTNLLAARPKDAEAWLIACDAGATKLPELQMDDFRSLFKKLRKNEVLGYSYAAQPGEAEAIRRLNDLRRRFMHFMPQEWSIEILYLIDVCSEVLAIAEKLEYEALPMRWREETQSTEFRDKLTEARSELEQLRAHAAS